MSLWPVDHLALVQTVDIEIGTDALEPYNCKEVVLTPAQRLSRRSRSPWSRF